MSVPAHTQEAPPAYVVTTPSDALRHYVDFLAGGGKLTPGTSEALASFSRLDDAFRDLLEAPESDEFGPVRPTPESVKVARETLFRLVERRFKLADAVDIATDHDGDLRIVWENGSRFLELIVPHEHGSTPYFYYSYGDQYNLQRDLTFPALRERFNWLSGGAS